MGTIVDARVSTEQFALSETFDAVPEATLEAVHVVIPRQDQLLPFFWGTATDIDELDTALADDPSVSDLRRLVTDENRNLYRIRWSSSVRMFVYMIVQNSGTLVDVQVQSDAWSFRIFFPDRDAMSNFYDFCKTYEAGVDINRVHDLRNVVQRGGTRLSTAQYEALSHALDSDYYSVPRGTTLVELSDRLGVSHQAVSERLRRGHQALIESNLHDGIGPSRPIS